MHVLLTDDEPLVLGTFRRTFVRAGHTVVACMTGEATLRKAGQDDFGAAVDGRLVLSQRALDTLSSLGISNALIEPFEDEGA